MIYMLKGKRYESSSTPGRWEQHSPLIRAYRKLIGTEYEYAPSLYYDNPSNKSGKGRLGKGWEPFNVWECEEVGYVKGWIQMLVEGKVQGDPLNDTFKIPGAYFRNQKHIDSWSRQAKAIEQDIDTKLRFLEKYKKNDLVEHLDYFFPQTRKHCHYPNDCSYINICYNTEIFNDPVGSGEFVYRKPHHEAEEREHARLYPILSGYLGGIRKTDKLVEEGKEDVGFQEGEGGKVRQESIEEVEILEDKEIIVE